MVVPDDWNYGIRKIHPTQNLRAHERMNFHSLKFCGRQATGFVENVRWNSQLANVVQ